MKKEELKNLYLKFAFEGFAKMPLLKIDDTVPFQYHKLIEDAIKDRFDKLNADAEFYANQNCEK